MGLFSREILVTVTLTSKTAFQEVPGLRQLGHIRSYFAVHCTNFQRTCLFSGHSVAISAADCAVTGFCNGI